MMKNLSLLLVTTFVLSQRFPSLEGCHSECSRNLGITISIDSNRKENGEWVTLFSATKNTSTLPKNIGLDLTQTIAECEGNHILKIQGMIKDNSSVYEKKSLFFHNKCSANAAIINKRRTLQKLKPGNDGVALTSRPLLDNEIFTIRLDKKDSTSNLAIGIGITTHSPIDLNIPDHMNNLKSGTWMFYNTHLFSNSAVVFSDYLKFNLKDVKVGESVGLMKSESGTLHFFLNGVDQGPAASNIPDTVYGVFELFGSTLQGTIIDAE